jgi:hypothetical protein
MEREHKKAKGKRRRRRVGGAHHLEEAIMNKLKIYKQMMLLHAIL